MRVVRTRVLPLPAPARMSAQPCGSVTAASCSALRFSRSGEDIRKRTDVRPIIGESTYLALRIAADLNRLPGVTNKMKLVGISMIRNDADIVEPFVRHSLRLLDHLFVVVHCPQDGTGEILSALLIIDHGNHALLRIGGSARQLPLPFVPELALAHYPVRSAAQL